MATDHLPQRPQSRLVAQSCDTDQGDRTVDVPATGGGIGDVGDQLDDLDVRAVTAGEALALSLIHMTAALRKVGR